MLKKDEMPERLKKRIWNVLYISVFRRGDKFMNREIPKPLREFIYKFWDDFVGEDISQLLDPQVSLAGNVKQVFSQLDWARIYDFIDFFSVYYPNDIMVKKEGVLNRIKKVLEHERASWTIVNNKVVPLLSDEEIKEIEKALSISDKFRPAREHINTALKHMSDRKNPDYENSIKESISAIESLVMIVEGEKKELPKLIDKLDIHSAMKEGFKKLYGWTSDASGIRHGEYGKSFPCSDAEARYMLVTCSAFINYVINKTAANKE